MLKTIFARRILYRAVERFRPGRVVRGAPEGSTRRNKNMANRATSFRAALFGLASAIPLAAAVMPAEAANKALKIGFVGVTSGPAAAWGTSNVRSMQTLAAWWNANGGVKIGDDTYDIHVVTFDDQKDPKRAIAGMEKMAQAGIHNVVRPNVDARAPAVPPPPQTSRLLSYP